MKGVGTFRRTLSSAMALIGLGGLGVQQHRMALPNVPQAAPKLTEEQEELRKPRKRRSSVRKGRTSPAKNWPLLFWGDCPRPVSRKVLKRIASNHPALVRK